MKYLIFLMPFILLFGCELFDYGTDYHTMYSDYDPDYEIDIPDITNNLESISPIYEYPEKCFYLTSIYVCSALYYTRDNREYWQTPAETDTLRSGDCEDRAIYFAYIFNKLTNLKCELWSIKNIKYNEWHFIAVYDGLYFGFPLFIESDGLINYLFIGDYLDTDNNFIIRDIYDFGTALYHAEYIK